MEMPHIALFHTRSIPSEAFAEFLQVVSTEGLSLQVEARDDDGPQAALEWLIPTAFIAYIAKPYFDGFLKEAGKDHYALLKVGLKSLYGKLVGPGAPQLTLVSSKGKLKSEQPYSLVYSIVAEAGADLRFKLLLERSATRVEYEEVISSFLAFLDAYHAGALGSTTLDKLKRTRVVCRTLLLAFNPTSGQIEPIDPLSNKSKP